MVLPVDNKIDPVTPAPSVSSMATHKFSSDISLLAAGYTDGTIKLFRYAGKK
jgi:hypothetical protein